MVIVKKKRFKGGKKREMKVRTAYSGCRPFLSPPPSLTNDSPSPSSTL